LGNIVYLEAKEVGEDVKQFVEFGTIESVKAASDVMAPLSGEIIERNEDVIDAPEVINEDPYGAWIIKIEVKDLKELANLLTADEYQLESK
jgi:glycine cleavage system H protein